MERKWSRREVWGKKQRVFEQETRRGERAGRTFEAPHGRAQHPLP